jgi:uncharacterized membrane protein
MNSWRIVRVIGFVLVVLGFGSAYMRTQLDMDTALTAWMGSAQPVSGIIMGLVGVVLVIVAFRALARAASARE